MVEELINAKRMKRLNETITALEERFRFIGNSLEKKLADNTEAETNNSRCFDFPRVEGRRALPSL
jgi:hypothetical protein